MPSGCQRRLFRRRAPTDPAHDVLDDDDAVVDQKAEGDDDGRDRYLFERDAERAHPDHREHHGERNDHRRDQSGPQPKEDDDEAGDDNEGLGDTRQGAVDGDATCSAWYVAKSIT